MFRQQVVGGHAKSFFYQSRITSRIMDSVCGSQVSLTMNLNWECLQQDFLLRLNTDLVDVTLDGGQTQIPSYEHFLVE